MPNVYRIVIFLLAISGIALAQQTTGDILGTVLDNSGAIVTGADVTAENIGTHETRTTKTSSGGEYVINLLKPGEYSVTISSPGFKTFTVQSLNLAAGDRVRVNAQLSIGKISESITVEAQASALQTDSSVLSNTVDEKQTQDLPLNGRNFTQLVQLVPGANEGPPDSLTNGTKLDDHRQSAAVSVNGQSDVLNNQMIDGGDNNERLIGTVGVRPSVEAISELRVQTSDYTAEVGRTGGGVVDVLTKSGTNTLHGSVFEFFRNDILDTNSFDFGAHLPKTELRQNQFGGSLGGAIRKDKTFFFGDYEGYRIASTLAPSLVVVPTAFEHNNPGNFSDSPGTGPTFGPAPMDPAGLAYFEALPLPNVGSNEFSANPRYDQSSNDFDIRIDHQFNDQNQMFARFIYNKVYTLIPGELPDATMAGMTINPNVDATRSPDLDYNAFLNYLHTFSSNLLVELKASYTRADNESTPWNDGKNPNAALGQPNVNTPIDDTTGLAPILVAASGDVMGDMIFQPLKDKDNTFQYLGSLTYTHGAHNLKFGAGIIRRQLTSFQSSVNSGFFLFLSYPDLLQGQYVASALPRSLELAPPHLRVWEASGYGQDDWRVNKRLTLNLGLRYDLFTPFTEIANRISTFDPVTGQLLIAGQNGVSNTAGIKTDHRGLEPRIGFAATLGHGLVVRGGYGISFVPMNTTSDANLKNPPFVDAVNCSFFTCGTFINGLPPIGPTGINVPGSVINDAVDPNFKTSYFQQYNLTLQKDFSGNVVTVSYVGILGRQLAQLLPDLNATPPNTCGNNPACYNALRPYYSVNPDLTTVGFFETHGKSSFNALQASFERRFHRGFALNANYQWAHNLDNAIGLSEEDAAGYGEIPSQVSTRDYGNSVLDIRHRIAVTANYELPFGTGSTGAKKALTKGWQANLIAAYTTGVPFTVTDNTSQSNIDGGGSGETDRANQIGDPHLSNWSIHEFFNTAAFALQPAGTLGDERRYQLHGPAFRHVDLSLFKTFPLAERLKLEFRAECFNLSNTANFAGPNAAIGGANYAQITAMSTNYTPREFQFALKLTF